MKQLATRKTTVRRRQKEPVLPSLRLSPQDKRKIGRLAKLRGTSASRSVMTLVEEALQTSAPTPASKNSIGPKRRLSGNELMALPAEVRHRRLEAQAKKAAIYYETDPDLDFQINDDIVSY